MLGLLALGLATAPSAGETQIALGRSVVVVEPYVACRSGVDRQIVALQQQLRAKSASQASYDVYSDPIYRELNDLDSKAQQDCDQPKYVALVRSVWGDSKSYDDFQKNKLAEFFVDDLVRAQWSLLNYQTGVYQFPKPALVAPAPNGTKN